MQEFWGAECSITESPEKGPEDRSDYNICCRAHEILILPSLLNGFKIFFLKKGIILIRINRHSLNEMK